MFVKKIAKQRISGQAIETPERHFEKQRELTAAKQRHNSGNISDISATISDKRTTHKGQRLGVPRICRRRVDVVCSFSIQEGGRIF